MTGKRDARRAESQETCLDYKVEHTFEGKATQLCKPILARPALI